MAIQKQIGSKTQQIWSAPDPLSLSEYMEGFKRLLFGATFKKQTRSKTPVMV